MNIFVLHLNPKIAALYHCNVHLIKMILESAQILSTTHRLLDGRCITQKRKIWVLDDPYMEEKLYKSTHYNHPCVQWTTKSKKNYKWLYKLFYHLCKRYTNLYGKTHLCETKLLKVLKRYPKNIPNKPRTPFPQAMPDEYKVEGDPVTAYRIYYLYDKADIADWRDQVPWWFTHKINFSKKII